MPTLISLAGCDLCQCRLPGSVCCVRGPFEREIFSEGLPSINHCAVVLQAVQAGTALSSLYRTIVTATHTLTQRPVRYVGMFTDGGTANMLREHGVDSMCARLCLANHCIKPVRLT